MRGGPARLAGYPTADDRLSLLRSASPSPARVCPRRSAPPFLLSTREELRCASRAWSLGWWHGRYQHPLLSGGGNGPMSVLRPPEQGHAGAEEQAHHQSLHPPGTARQHRSHTGSCTGITRCRAARSPRNRFTTGRLSRPADPPPVCAAEDIARHAAGSARARTLLGERPQWQRSAAV